MRSPRSNSRKLVDAAMAVMFSIGIAAVICCAALLFGGCATGPRSYANVPLVDQVLHADASKPGWLYNRACLTYDKGACTVWDVRQYALADEAFRKSAVELGMVCNVAGARWKICPDKAGLCQYTYHRAWFLAPKRLEIRFMPAEPWQPWLDADVRCMNEDRNPFEDP